MPDWLWSLAGGLVAGVLVALLTEWCYLGPLRRRCWRAEITLAQLRADPDGRAALDRLAALTQREKETYGL